MAGTVNSAQDINKRLELALWAWSSPVMEISGKMAALKTAAHAHSTSSEPWEWLQRILHQSKTQGPTLGKRVPS